MIALLATAGPESKSMLETFGINGPMFAAQCINFILVICVLKKFAFGPIQKMLVERRERIAAGEEKLKQIEKQLAESEAATAAAIEKANEEAQRMIEEAKVGAAAFSEQKAQEAIASAQQILSKAEVAAKAEREKIANELKQDFGRLLVAATGQVTGKVLTQEDQLRINEEAMKQVQG